MGLYSLANVLVGYHLSRDETRYAWIVVAAAPIQVVALAVVPLDLQDVVWANLVVATGAADGARDLRRVERARRSSRAFAGCAERSTTASGGVVREGVLVLLGATRFRRAALLAARQST